MSKNRIFKVCTIIFGSAILLIAVYIMFYRLGINENLDFGAGAYFYADIPEFEKYEKNGYNTSVPRWIHIVLFLAWGFLMYKLWTWVDKKTTPKD